MAAKAKFPETPSLTKTPEYIKDFFIWKYRYYFKIQTGPTIYFVIDRVKKICEKVNIAVDKETEQKYEAKREIMAHFSIFELTEYPSLPELYSKPMFSFNAEFKGEKRKIGPAPLDEIVGDLKTQALFQKVGVAMDTLTSAVNALKANGQYTVQTLPPYPGFFILNGKFTATESYVKPNKGQMRDALEMFNQLGGHYNEFGSKLGYIAHWMIMAPFSFVMKQKGLSNLLSHLFLYGTTRTGKTTIARLSCFFWGLNIEQQLTSGSHVHSTYQYGRQISQSTFPIIIDEGEAVLQNPELRSMLKTSTHSTSCRSRYNSFLQREEEIPALALSIVTSNYSKPDDGALGARLDVLKYTASEIRSQQDREEFDEKFQPRVQNGPLQVLRFIGHYVAARVIDDPGLLDVDWKETSQQLWRDMYELADIEMPEWMENISTPEGVEESVIDETEYYISNIKALILRKADPYLSKTNIYGEVIEEHIYPRDKAEDVVKVSREPWIHYHKPKAGPDAGKEFVWIEKSIETDLKRDKGIDIKLDRIAELLGGRYVRKNTPSGKRYVAVFEYSKFLDLYSNELDYGELDPW